MTPAAAVDFGAVADAVDLRRLVEACLGAPAKVVGGKPHWCCPFHADSSPSFYLWDDCRRWWCWPCSGRGGDAIDFLSRFENITPLEAARRLDPAGRATLDRGTRPARPAKPPDRPAAWEDPAWQVAADRIVREAEGVLWGPAGTRARDYLHGRGLADHTIRRFRLGFLPRGYQGPALDCLAGPDGTPRRLFASRGITIPWVRPGSWYDPTPDPDGADPGPRWVGVNVRRLDGRFQTPAEGSKYHALLRSTRGHLYPHPDLAAGVPVLLCEGEFDALIGWQEAGWVANVATVGGTMQKPTPLATAALAGCPRWLMAFDADDAGNEAARVWAQWGRSRADRLDLPAGRDLADMHADGHILGWLADEYRRIGQPWPARP